MIVLVRLIIYYLWTSCQSSEVSCDFRSIFYFRLASASDPTVTLTIPALERMYSKWEKLCETPDAKPFQAAIDPALAKVNEYYVKTAKSDAHVMAMCMSNYLIVQHLTEVLCSLTSMSEAQILQKELV